MCHDQGSTELVQVGMEKLVRAVAAISNCRKARPQERVMLVQLGTLEREWLSQSRTLNKAGFSHQTALRKLMLSKQIILIRMK